MVVYSWDEVICEISKWVQDEAPKGISDEDLLLLADARISKDTGDEFGTFDHKIRDEGGVLVLDAQFGQHKVTRTYICKEDPERARKLAEKELAAFLDD